MGHLRWAWLLLLYLAGRAIAGSHKDPHPFLPYNVRDELLDITSWQQFVDDGFYAEATTGHPQVDAIFYLAYNRVMIKNGKLHNKAENLFFNLDNELLKINRGSPQWVKHAQVEDLSPDIHACVNYSLGLPAYPEDEYGLFSDFTVNYDELLYVGFVAYPVLMSAPDCPDPDRICESDDEVLIQQKRLRSYRLPLCDRAAKIGYNRLCHGDFATYTDLQEFVCVSNLLLYCINDGCGPLGSPYLNVTSGRYQCACNRVYATPGQCDLEVACTLPGCANGIKDDDNDKPSEAADDDDDEPSSTTDDFNVGGIEIAGWEWFLLLAFLLLFLLLALVALRLADDKSRRVNYMSLVYLLAGCTNTMTDLGFLYWVVFAVEGVPFAVYIFAAVIAYLVVNFLASMRIVVSPSARSRVWYNDQLTGTLGVAVAFVTILPSMALMTIAPETTTLWYSNLGHITVFSNYWGAVARWRACVASLLALLLQTVGVGVAQLVVLFSVGYVNHIQVAGLVACVLMGLCRLVFLYPLFRYYHQARGLMWSIGMYVSPPTPATARIFLNEKKASHDDFAFDETDVSYDTLQTENLPRQSKMSVMTTADSTIGLHDASTDELVRRGSVDRIKMLRSDESAPISSTSLLVSPIEEEASVATHDAFGQPPRSPPMPHSRAVLNAMKQQDAVPDLPEASVDMHDNYNNPLWRNDGAAPGVARRVTWSTPVTAAQPRGHEPVSRFSLRGMVHSDSNHSLDSVNSKSSNSSNTSTGSHGKLGVRRKQQVHDDDETLVGPDDGIIMPLPASQRTRGSTLGSFRRSMSKKARMPKAAISRASQIMQERSNTKRRGSVVMDLDAVVAAYQAAHGIHTDDDALTIADVNAALDEWAASHPASQMDRDDVQSALEESLLDEDM